MPTTPISSEKVSSGRQFTAQAQRLHHRAFPAVKRSNNTSPGENQVALGAQVQGTAISLLIWMSCYVAVKMASINFCLLDLAARALQQPF